MTQRIKINQFVRFLKDEHIYHMFQTEAVSANLKVKTALSIYDGDIRDAVNVLFSYDVIISPISALILISLSMGTIRRDFWFWKNRNFWNSFLNRMPFFNYHRNRQIPLVG